MTKDKRMRKVRARQKADAESGRARDTTERFDGQLPAILPELQWPEEFSCRVGKEALRRFELTNRAYSAAVYAHADHFPPRWESLLLGRTKKLLRSEKEQLLMSFEQECFAVVGSLREWLGRMRPIPPAERIVLLKDYQAWMGQVRDLLREAVFADESEAWNRDLLHLFQSQKPDEPFAREAFRHLIEKPVFFEHMYLEKFTELFFAQMQLDQRVGLMTDIVLDLIRAYEARVQDKRRLQIAQKPNGQGQASEIKDTKENGSVAKGINIQNSTVIMADGNTIINIDNRIEYTNHIANLRDAIEAQPEDSPAFAKIAKKTTLDIVGSALKDVAKGQVKEAAKQVCELAKDLGPVIMQTAAYAFLKSHLG